MIVWEYLGGDELEELKNHILQWLGRDIIGKI